AEYRSKNESPFVPSGRGQWAIQSCGIICSTVGCCANDSASDLDDMKGLSFFDLYSAQANDPRAEATRKRGTALQTLGNLTILSSSLNSAQKNYGWPEKKPEMMKHSLLPLNQQLFEVEHWDEVAIKVRAESLFGRAIEIWRQ
ncbi:HNH endonuclease family protein, partial [Rhizobium johnstonii]